MLIAPEYNIVWSFFTFVMVVTGLGMEGLIVVVIVNFARKNRY
jgi:hypothetical protein